MENLIIIGSGPAGASAALYAARAGLAPLLLSQGVGALEKAECIENFYGSGPMPGVDLHRQGERQAEALGARIVRTQVLGVSGFDTYTVTTTDGAYEAIAVILATGVKRAVPQIAGLRELDGRGVSYCAVCDAFFYRGKKVAVLGSGDFALSEAEELGMAGSVTILTGGAPKTFSRPCPYPLDERPVAAVLGEEQVTGVRFTDGTELPIDGLFLALGTAGGSEIARRIGAALDDQGNVKVDAAMQTALPGLFAAGDCTGGMLQVAKAAHDGMTAGLSAIQYVRDYRKRHPQL